jgi:hypothetical protein
LTRGAPEAEPFWTARAFHHGVRDPAEEADAAVDAFAGGLALVPRSRAFEEVSERVTSLTPASVPANVSLIMRS